MIKFDNVTATYKKNIGIFNISFEVKPGELVFIMGPTGAGKSTILKTIYKDIFIDSGKILLDKKEISNSNSDLTISNTRSKIGMIFQDFKLLNDRNVYDNVALPLRIEGVSDKNIKDMVRESLNKVNMSSYELSYPLELSGGEQQRIAIARALVNNPKIILADEPTGNLDPNISDEILDLLEMFTANGSAVLMSTHNFPLIKPRNKKFIELSKGRMV
ncbi:MAG: cell division ATP-binding protein FtsE [Candidatus Marinimicrobia bacterium]|nr:cell division ATP-binding protein FtsE [Candidatus Neomarinimicrobiota bacterium]|tara:strand:+ start:7482 stop:8132 length:651 start_codon:yes stop_codon:yes gene_type:complete